MTEETKLTSSIRGNFRKHFGLIMLSQKARQWLVGENKIWRKETHHTHTDTFVLSLHLSGQAENLNRFDIEFTVLLDLLLPHWN